MSINENDLSPTDSGENQVVVEDEQEDASFVSKLTSWLGRICSKDYPSSSRLDRHEKFPVEHRDRAVTVLKPGPAPPVSGEGPKPLTREDLPKIAEIFKKVQKAIESDKEYEANREQAAESETE